ncbi:MAG: hypothetical protein U0802_22655 [Candidatus Binatia bacterium]
MTVAEHQLRADRRQAGIVDQQVRLAELRGLGHGAGDGGLARDVRLDRRDRGAVRAGELDRAARPRARSQAATRRPTRAAWMAVACPMPLPAPVTMMTEPGA